MKRLQAKRFWILPAVLALLMLTTANLWGVIETSEARYAEISREMFRSGDWMHPTLLNIYHYHKPPITYWLTAGAYWALGVNAFAARFLLVIAYCLQVFLIFKLSQQLFNNKSAAYYAALIYATSPMVLISVRGLTTDAYLNTFLMLSVYAWLMFLKSGKVRFVYGMAAAMCLAFMTKGPVAFVIPILAMVGLRNWYPSTRISMLQGAIALLIFVFIGFTWFTYLIVEDPRLAHYFFFRHFVDRFAHAEVFARAEPWYYYLPILLLSFVPWITFFIGGFLFKTRSRTEDGDGKLALILTRWLFLFPLLIFSFSSSKLVLYILPLSIGFSLVTGYFLANGIQKKMFWLFPGPIFLVYLCLIFLPSITKTLQFETFLNGLPIVALFLSTTTLFLKVSKGRVVSILSVLFSGSLILFASQFFKTNSIEVNSLSLVSSFLKENNLTERNIIIYNELLPSLAFDLDKPILSVYAGNRSLIRETQFETNDSWRNTLIDTTDQKSLKKLNLLLSQKSVLVLQKDLPLILRSNMQGTWHKKMFGKWMAYYN